MSETELTITELTKKTGRLDAPDLIEVAAERQSTLEVRQAGSQWDSFAITSADLFEALDAHVGDADYWETVEVDGLTLVYDPDAEGEATLQTE